MTDGGDGIDPSEDIVTVLIGGTLCIAVMIFLLFKEGIL